MKVLPKQFDFKAKLDEALRQLERYLVSKTFGFENRTSPFKENIVIVRHDHVLEKNLVQFAHNIVTNDGDRYYAQRACTESPHFTVAGIRMGSNAAGGTGKTKTDVNTFVGTAKAATATYPKSNDSDPNNTGRLIDAVSWRFDWATSENNLTMDELAICDSLSAPTKALTHATFTSFLKTSSQALIVFVNHEMLGV